MKGKSRLAAVDYEGPGNYNSVIEFLVNCTLKVQFVFCPLLAPVWAIFQNILKNTCRNEPGKRLK